MDRQPRVWILGLIISVLLAGCGTADTSNSATPAASSAGAFKVAMILPGTIDDKAWSQAGYEGLKLIQDELGATIAYSENVADAAAEQALRTYAEQGYNFIVAHGGQYIQPAEAAAAAYPRTKFAVVASYPGNNANLGALSFRDSEIGYLAGVVAGLKTTSNTIAFIGGEEYPHTKEEATFFERGAHAINPNIKVNVAWVGSWSDRERTRVIAQQQVDAGADVLLANVNEASQEIFAIAQQTQHYAIAWSWDQHELAPAAILTSAVQETPVLLLRGATLVQQGRWEGKQYKFGLRDGAQSLAPFYNMLTSDEETRVKAVQNDIVTGKLVLAP